MSSADLTPCPKCETKSKVISLHWSNSNTCEHPPIPDELHQVLGGIYAVRGTLSGSSPSTGRKNFRLLKNDKEPVSELRDVLGVFATDIQTREKKTMDDTVVEQYELATITHPQICDEYLLAAEPTDLYFKAAVTVAGVYNECGSYRITLRPEVAERSRAVFESVASVVDDEYLETDALDWDPGECVTYYIPKSMIDELHELEWPSGWWNSKPYY